MSHTIMVFELFVELSNEEQQLFVGAANSEQTSSDYTQAFVNRQGTNTSGPLGNSANFTLQNNFINSSARNSWGADGVIPAGIGALPPTIVPSNGTTTPFNTTNLV